MPFNLDVNFSGLCCFVPNKEWRESPSEICALLPNATEEELSETVGGEPVKKRALDGEDLERHRGILRIPTKNLNLYQPSAHGGFFPRSEAVIYLHRQRISFKPVFVAETPSTTVNYNSRLDVPVMNDFFTTETERRDINSIIDLALISGKKETNQNQSRACINPENLKIRPSNTSALSQILLQYGKLEATNVRSQKWECSSILSGRRFRRFLAHRSRFRISNLNSIILVLTPWDGGDPIELPLWAAAGENSVSISVNNTGSRNPLSWIPKEPPAVQADDDLRWYFELLEEECQSEIKDVLKSNPAPHNLLPIPRPFIEDGSLPSGDNCLDCRVDKHDLSNLPFIR